jgi:2-polyprenyl-6-methoxyphenol hydroxylase-like FAD-dependent oxidoreductase
MTTDFDVIIVGARIAGSITAALLGEYGYKVLLLDRARFPSDTLSTHFFRAPALKAFQRAGVFEQVQGVAPHMVETFNDVEGHMWSDAVGGEDGFDYLLCVRRITLDAILAERVQQERNINFLQGARFTELVRKDESVMGAKWVDNSGEHETTARVIVGADGFYSKMAELVKPEVEQFEPVHRAMYYTYFQGLSPRERPSAEFYFRGDHLVYVFPTDGNHTLIAVSVPISEFELYRRDAKSRMMSMLTSLPALSGRLISAEIVSPVKGAGNIPCYQRVPYGDGWVLVGDAGQVFDPWSGQGIDHASRHAVMLADAIHQFFENKKTWKDAMSEYHSLRNSSSRKNFENTRKFARDLRPMSHGALKNRGLLE